MRVGLGLVGSGRVRRMSVRRRRAMPRGVEDAERDAPAEHGGNHDEMEGPEPRAGESEERRELHDRTSAGIRSAATPAQAIATKMATPPTSTRTGGAPK